MENADQNSKSNLGVGLRILALSTGLMAYLPFFLLTSNGYLESNNPYFAKDIFLLILSVIIIIGAILVWRAMYKQFKKDKTLLGFSPDKNGYTLITEAVIEAAIVFLGIYLTTSHF